MGLLALSARPLSVKSTSRDAQSNWALSPLHASGV
jgi:hypothetical protein